MKKIAVLILSLVFFGTTAVAENVGIRNENATTHTATEGALGPVAMDRANRLIVAPSLGAGDFSSQMSLTPLFVVADAAEALSTTTVIVATAHVARVNDYVKFTAGTAANIGVWRRVLSVDTNSITVASAFPATVAAADAFNIYRPTPDSSIYAEDAAHVSTDLGQLVFGVRNDASATTTSTDGDLGAMSLTSRGAVQTALIVGGEATLSPIMLEDTGFGSAGALMMAGYVNNEGAGTSFNTTNGDAVPPSANRYGAQYVIQSSVLMGSSDIAASFMKAEDATASSGEWGTHILGKRLDQLATGETGSNNEYATPIVDTLSRLYINPWGAAVTEHWQSCGTATASTANVEIKAAVASNRNYVTSINCASSDADNATNINFKDGTTVIAVGGVNQMATTSAGTFTAVFNTPLRGTSNTAFNFNTAVSTSSVICCATGFISPY